MRSVFLECRLVSIFWLLSELNIPLKRHLLDGEERDELTDDDDERVFLTIFQKVQEALG